MAALIYPPFVVKGILVQLPLGVGSQPQPVGMAVLVGLLERDDDGRVIRCRVGLAPG